MTTSASSGVIKGSKHDLSSGGDAQVGAGGEICVFCHTPHGSNTTAAVPLWNKTLTDPSSYTLYNATSSSTIDGDVAAVGSVSLACLSCHDGTQAMDAVLNVEGSGGYNASGSGGTTTMAGDITTPGTGGAIPNLNTDLTNDHPVGIEYGSLTGDSAQYQALSGTSPQQWVDTTGPGVREKADLTLYDRGDGTARVECATCHDPHNGPLDSAGAPDVGAAGTFLRIANTNSAVCLTCHIK